MSQKTEIEEVELKAGAGDFLFGPSMNYTVTPDGKDVIAMPNEPLRPMTPEEEWAVWALMSKRLAKSNKLSEPKRQLSENVFDCVMRLAMVQQANPRPQKLAIYQDDLPPGYDQ